MGGGCEINALAIPLDIFATVVENKLSQTVYTIKGGGGGNFSWRGGGGGICMQLNTHLHHPICPQLLDFDLPRPLPCSGC